MLELDWMETFLVDRDKHRNWVEKMAVVHGTLKMDSVVSSWLVVFVNHSKSTVVNGVAYNWLSHRNACVLTMT